MALKEYTIENVMEDGNKITVCLDKNECFGLCISIDSSGKNIKNVVLPERICIKESDESLEPYPVVSCFKFEDKDGNPYFSTVAIIIENDQSLEVLVSLGKIPDWDLVGGAREAGALVKFKEIKGETRWFF